jgi:hypothetical protein
MFEKYQNSWRSPQPPLQRGAKFLKVPLFKGDLGGSAGVKSHTKKFSNNLLCGQLSANPKYKKHKQNMGLATK